MKTSSNNLFQLIKSLTRSEKRYFKQFSSIYSDSTNNKTYIKIFDLIDESKKYDELKLKLKLKDKSSIRNLKRLKSYLSKAILRSLENYHSHYSVEIILARQLQQTEVLFGKRLFGMALKIVRHSIKTAQENDQFLYALLFLSWEGRLLRLDNDIDDIELYASQGFESAFHYLSSCKEQFLYNQLLHQIAPLIKSKVNYNHREKRKFEKIIYNPMLMDVKNKNLPYESKKAYYQIMIFTTRALDDWESSHRFRKELVEYIESFEPKGINKAFDYLSAIHNLLLALNRLRRYDDFDHYFEKANQFMNSLESKFKTRIILRSHLTIIELLMECHLRLGNYEQALTVSNRMKTIIVTNTNDFIDTRMKSFYYYFSYVIHFCLSDFHSALKCLNSLLKINDEDLRKEMKFGTKFLLFLVHYELNNTDLLISLSKSIRRYLIIKRGSILKYEELLIELFGKKIFKAETKADHLALFAETKKHLIRLMKNKNEAKGMGHFDFISWIDSKIKNKPFAEIVREKAKAVAGS